MKHVIRENANISRHYSKIINIFDQYPNIKIIRHGIISLSTSDYSLLYKYVISKSSAMNGFISIYHPPRNAVTYYPENKFQPILDYLKLRIL